MSYLLHSMATLLFCYMIGSILFGLIISESVYGVDIRKYGSGNVGFTNIKRTLGWKPALTVLVLDALKGTIAVWISRRTFGGHPNQDVLVLLGGILSIIGHNWSLFYEFAGGKGVATSLGVLIALDPRAALLALACGMPLLFYPGYMSLASAVGTASVPIWFWVLGDPVPYRFFGLLMVVFVLVRHRANWGRIRKGIEPKFTFRGPVDIMAQPDSPSGAPGPAGSPPIQPEPAKPPLIQIDLTRGKPAGPGPGTTPTEEAPPTDNPAPDGPLAG